MIEQFKIDVKKGLSATPKFLSSKYFYDKKGDDLFVQIMNSEEYYLTRAEFEIFSNKKQDLINALGVEKDTFFEIIELGAGDGTKTKQLLNELVKQEYNFDYAPIDISQNALNKLEASLKIEIPELKVNTQQGDYFEVLSSFKELKHKKIILFLGSNIGNLKDDLSHTFIYYLGANLNPNDMLLLGVDLIKHEDVVLPAYNDSEGLTAKFNLNLLTRINNELGGDFNVSQFIHAPEYIKKEGIAKSHILSTENQTVTIKSINESFTFKKDERIHTEISRKYNDQIITKIIKNTNFTISNKIMDSNNYFADYILKRN
jgi:L-histidine N-alpha-methyltransferase